jgi:hypothetical protein
VVDGQVIEEALHHRVVVVVVFLMETPVHLPVLESKGKLHRNKYSSRQKTINNEYWL